MVFEKMSPTAIVEQLGERLKQARLNADLTQAELASRTGLNRRTILNAEKGNVQLKNLVAILVSLGMVEQINMFLPVQEISPLQLAKLKGKKRQRASRTPKKKRKTREDESLW
ncbi:helix-turn-helix transcriptional regulator [Desulfobacter vibrioformis]|uniref:helix-turn-helix transcriptional regulator n=1 Tax=Desulfobacter vibrioformis TaxID=34031 RepID=UPI000553A155|nr:helix-turn-helix transcriptional regulator [Desulfobacter vibrioformis]